jgi:MFS family permease
MPAVSTLYVRWTPLNEKTRLIGFGFSGSNIGNIIALPLGGYLCSNGFDGGWPSIFYVFGAAGILWFLVFMIVVTDSPQNHWFISSEEKEYIITTADQIDTSNRKIKPPWKELFTTKECLAIYIGHFTYNWGNYLFLTELPSFMKEVLDYDIKAVRI